MRVRHGEKDQIDPSVFQALTKKMKNINKITNKFGAVRRDKIELIRLDSVRFDFDCKFILKN
jgi:hypothetical protein